MREDSVRSGWIEALEKRELLSVTAKIRLLGSESTIFAGNNVQVSAVPNKHGTGTNLGAGSPITSKYEWDFGDHTPGASYSILPGFNAAHLYDTPGSYKLVLRITNALGESATAARTITVLPSQRRTIYINSRGDNRNDGSSAQTAIRTIARAQELLSDNTTILFRRGRTYVFPAALSLQYRNVQIGAYGKGTTPDLQIPVSAKLYTSAFLMNPRSHQILIENVLIESPPHRIAGEAIRSCGTNIAIRNCQF